MHFLFTLIITGLYLFPTEIPLDHGKIVPYNEAWICLSPEEKDLYNQINNYRKSKGSHKIRVSRALTYVAKIHALDLYNYYDEDSRICNLHSWSKNGPWEHCCYTQNHKNAKCMWFKPAELTTYGDVAYEIVFYSTYPSDLADMAGAALEGWQGSPGHDEMILNDNEWNSLSWNAIGVAVYKNYAVVWFGEEADTDGSPKNCY